MFFSFWQGVLIAVLADTGVIPEDPTWTIYNQEALAAGLQDFLICVEMFIAAIAHRYVFSYTEYLDRQSAARYKRLSFAASLKKLIYITDVQDDLVGSLRSAIGRPKMVEFDDCKADVLLLDAEEDDQLSSNATQERERERAREREREREGHLIENSHEMLLINTDQDLQARGTLKSSAKSGLKGLRDNSSHSNQDADGPYSAVNPYTDVRSSPRRERQRSETRNDE